MPAPAFAEPPSSNTLAEKAFFADTDSESTAAAQASALLTTNRKQPLRAHFGFFEQALLINLGFVLVSTATLVSGSAYLLKHVRLPW